jgi:hypothetical protein
MGGKEPFKCSVAAVPDTDNTRGITGGGECIVMSRCCSSNGLLMGGRLTCGISGGVAETQSFVVRPRGRPCSAGGGNQATNDGGMPLKWFCSHWQFPDANRTVAARTDDPLAVGVNNDVGNDTGVAGRVDRSAQHHRYSAHEFRQPEFPRRATVRLVRGRGRQSRSLLLEILWCVRRFAN